MTLTALEYALGNSLLALPLVALAWAIGRTRRHPTVAHFAWLLVMIRLVMPPVVSVPWLSIQVPVSGVTLADPAVPRAAASSALESRGSERPMGSVDSFTIRTADSSEPVVRASADLSFEPRVAGLVLADGWTALGLLWLGGTALIVAVSAARLMRFQRMLRANCSPADPRVRELAERAAADLGIRLRGEIVVILASCTPFVWSCFGRPRIVLPAQIVAQMSDDELRIVLTHELAHVRRCDHLVRWLDWAVVAWLWWNPLAWIARGGLRKNEELACDALVLHAQGAAARDYGLCLVSVAESIMTPAFRAPVQTCTMGEGGSLEERIRLIMSDNPRTKPSVTLRSLTIVAAGASMLFGVTCIGSHQAVLAATPSEPPTTPATTPTVPASYEADHLSRTLEATIEDARSLHVQSKFGSITIVRDESAKGIQVTASIRSDDVWVERTFPGRTTIERLDPSQRLSSEQLKWLIDSARLVAEKDSSGRAFVRVELPMAQGLRHLPSVDIMIRTAALAEVHAESMSGDVATIGDLGKVQVTTSSGNIDVSGVVGSLQAETANGNIAISLAEGAAGTVDADCASGHVLLEVPATWNGEVSASTVVGTMVVRDIDGTTTLGPVGTDFKGKVGSGKGAVATLDVTNGSIEVRKC